ncbi:hypothetical protein QV08_05855 [Gallibacterium salpingitidis]|uniref:Zinc-type alcohol dehydrogenase-like protein n=1 Tax=Gallibacterium salpingitidis TaxID=505341 RepID=A0AB36E3R8_9PAST|nr:zinc-binding alcohol dehydrogenase family protein [Gallibacterium salpingitidis]OBX08027.1 hypothetical protein QV08_05855 [Gallibacterium salpingitidis]OBX11271.1 hypothetical protein QV09_03360 [Gallibacterium salpingitidis]WKT00674.1 zinc-binding alcohol dehydrogenase family protein [Gallibacterium salpingitidis]
MKAIGFNTPLPINNVNSLLEIELPIPEIGEYDILVKIEAVSVNPADVKIRASHQLQAGNYRVLGYDAAGIITQLGSKVTQFTIGDKVYYAGAINRMGSNAEYQAVDSRIAAKMPSNLSFAEAAALPLTMLTAWETLFDRLNINKDTNQTLLLIGGAGGVGSATIQLAKALTNLTVIATASRPKSVDWCRKLGADYVINHHQLTQQFAEYKLPAPEFVFSTNHTDSYLPQIANLIAPQGKLALIDDPTVFDINPLKGKSVSVHWEFMFTRSLYSTTDMQKQGEILTNVSKLIEQKRLVTTLTHTPYGLNVTNLKQAHALVEQGNMIGKIVLAL